MTRPLLGAASAVSNLEGRVSVSLKDKERACLLPAMKPQAPQAHSLSWDTNVRHPPGPMESPPRDLGKGKHTLIFAPSSLTQESRRQKDRKKTGRVLPRSSPPTRALRGPPLPDSAAVGTHLPILNCFCPLPQTHRDATAYQILFSVEIQMPGNITFIPSLAAV